MGTMIENAATLGTAIQKLTKVQGANPAAFARLTAAIEQEFGRISTATMSARFEDAQETINAMSNGPRQAAEGTVAELTAEWDRIRPTLKPAELERLTAMCGPNPVALCMRAKLIAEYRATGRDARIVGGL